MYVCYFVNASLFATFVTRACSPNAVDLGQVQLKVHTQNVYFINIYL